MARMSPIKSNEAPKTISFKYKKKKYLLTAYRVLCLSLLIYLAIHKV